MGHCGQLEKTVRLGFIQGRSCKMVNHPNRKKTYPDHTLVDAARAAGITVLALWAIRGPKGTFIDWMVGYQIAHQLVIVQTYKDGDGWNAFVASPSIDTSKTIADVFERCGVQVQAAG